jgi:hypothetical protein
MPVPEACEWSLRPSRWQGYLDGAALMIPLGIIGFLGMAGNLFSVAMLMVLGGGALLWHKRHVWPEQRIQRIGLDAMGWWLHKDGSRLDISWRSHSLKRSRLVVLRWSVWPWDALVLRADSFSSEEEFRRFRACLYGHL